MILRDKSNFLKFLLSQNKEIVWHTIDQNKNDYSNIFAKHRGRLDVLPSDSRRNDLATTPDRKKPKTSEYVRSSIEIKEYFTLEANNILLRITVDITRSDTNEIINAFLNSYNHYKSKGSVTSLT